MVKRQHDPQESVIDAAVLRAAALAAAGVSQAKIAQELGVSESTISRWKKRTDYQAARNGILKDAVETASNRLRSLTLQAVGILRDTMNDPKATHCDRIRAATAILDRVLGDKASYQNIGCADEAELQERQRTDEAMAEMMRGWQ
jgi:transcriptional regulator with XRE-family HTH domain